MHRLLQNEQTIQSTQQFLEIHPRTSLRGSLAKESCLRPHKRRRSVCLLPSSCSSRSSSNHACMPLRPLLASCSSSWRVMQQPSGLASCCSRNSSSSSGRRLHTGAVRGGCAGSEGAAACRLGRSLRGGSSNQPITNSSRVYTAVAAADDRSASNSPLEDVLARVRAAVRGAQPLDRAGSNTNATVFGAGVHMGLSVAWAFMWRPDGAFYEEVRSRHLTYKWGFDGGPHSQCWEVDPSGVSKVLERDDHEASLLGALIRSGGWLVPEVAARMLQMELEDAQQPSTLAAQYMPILNMPPVAATWDAQPPSLAGRQPTVAAAAAGTQPRPLQQQQQPHPGGKEQASARHVRQTADSSTQQVIAAAATSRQDAPNPLQQQQQAPPVEQEQCQQRFLEDFHGPKTHVVLKLKNGRMLARVQVSTTTWQPLTYRQPLCSDTELWMLQDWANWTGGGSRQQHQEAADLFYPRRVVHMLFQGCAHTYSTEGAITRGAEVHTAYQLPSSPPVPIDVQFLDSSSPTVPVWQTSQGHLLMQAHINGRNAGWMLLDTGASGFVIEPSVADQFRLPRFGDLRIAGVSGKVATRFRRASQLRLGPLVISDPVLMEMAVSRLVGSFHDRVVGIAGYDVFRRCRVTLPCHNTRKAIRKASSSAGRVSAYNAELQTSAAVRAAAHPWPPTAHVQQQLQQLAGLQQDIAAAAAAGGGHSTGGAAPTVAASMSSSNSNEAPALQQLVPSRRSQRSTRSSSSECASRRRRPPCTPATTAAATADITPSTSQPHCEPPVSVPPLDYWAPGHPLPPSNTLIEVLLQKPAICGRQQLEDGYIWQDLVMIASLPHVELEFVVPGQPGRRHTSLFLIDTGAGGAEVMFHSRAARELGLLDLQPEDHHAGWGQGNAQERYVSGVSDSADAKPASVFPRSQQQQAFASAPATTAVTSSTTAKQPAARLSCLAGRLPELLIRGQAGANVGKPGTLQLSGVRALFNSTGGLDISLYSAGMVCADLLSRMQVVLDYPNRVIGWKVPQPGTLK